MKKLNKELETKAKELNSWLLNQELIKEYKKYEQAIIAHPELSKLEQELKALQQTIVKEKNLDHDCETIIKEYEEKKGIFFENPLVHNYLLLKEEVNDLCQQINDIINKEIEL